MFQKLKKNEYFCIFLSLPIYCRFLRNDVFWTPAIFSPKRFLQHCVIHQFAQAGFSEEPPENEQSMLIFADFRVQQVL
jgi:hypothetical protein